jgi:L-idonate 5-dehydrogenase
LETRICRLHGKDDIRIETAPVTGPGPDEALVAIGAGGICGSDLHYYHEGGFGPIRVQEPIILGHEAAGTIVEVGDGVTNVAPGDRVSINPSRPCGQCEYCAAGLPTHCLAMRFNGSALRFPHEQGLFRDRMVVDASQCLPVGDAASMAEAACAEPLAVALHANNMAGEVVGRRVLVTGAGPIGSLCAAVAAHRGAAEVVVTDLQDLPLEVVRRLGATRTLNATRDAAQIEAYAADKGYFHIVFECTAAAPAIKAGIAALRPQGRFVQVGVQGDTPVPLNMIVGKEITIQGTHRFVGEFAEAVEIIRTRAIEIRPVVTGSYRLSDALEAFKAAGDRSRAVKVQISFGDA